MLILPAGRIPACIMGENFGIEAMLATKSHHGKSVNLALGETLTVQLPETPTTGFRWAIVSEPASMLTLVSDNFIMNAGSELGGGGMRQFLFRADQPGSGALTLKLQRAWESNAPSDQFSISITTS
jgi:inhibitor of cysteine peptidase